MHPKLSPGIAVERVDSGLDARPRIDIGARDNPIWRDEHVAMKEVFWGIAAHVGFPTHGTGVRIEPAEEPVARTEKYGVTRDRGRVCDSAPGFKSPEDDRDVRLAAAEVRRGDQHGENSQRGERSSCKHFTPPVRGPDC